MRTHHLTFQPSSIPQSTSKTIVGKCAHVRFRIHIRNALLSLFTLLAGIKIAAAKVYSA